MTRQRGLCHAAALKEDNDEKKTRDPRPSGRYGKIADGRALRRGRSVLSRYELRHALVRGQLHAGGASQSGEVRARPRCARPRDGEYDAAQRRGRAPARALGAFERRRCRRAYFGRPRRVYARGEVCAQVRAARLHAAVHRQLRVRPRVVRFGREKSGAGKGSIFTGNSRNAGKNSRGIGDRDLLPRRDVRELFGQMPALKLYDRPRLKPRPVRPALPLPVCADGGETSGRIFPRLRG